MKQETTVLLTYIKNNWKNILFFLVFAFLLVAMCSLSWFCNTNWIDSDFVFDDIKIARAIKENGLFFNHLIANNELGQSRPWIITLLAHSITNDWLVSTKITLIVTQLIIILLFSLLLKELGFKYKAIMIANILLIGIDCGEVSFRYYQVYNLHSILILLFLLLYINIFFTMTGKVKYFKLAVLSLIAFVQGMVGQRFLLIVILPLFIMETVIFLNEIRGQENHIFPMILSRKRFIFACVFLLINGIGLLWFKWYIEIMGDYTSVPMLFRHPKEILDSFSSIVSNFLLQLCITSVDFIHKKQALELLLRLFLYLINLIGIIWFFKIKSEPNANNNHKKIQFILVFFLTSLSFTLSTGLLFRLNNYPPRYFFAVWFLISIITAIIYEKVKTKLYKLILVFTLMPLVLLCFINRDLPEYNKEKTENEMLAQFLVDDSYDIVYGTYWNSGILEGLSNGRLRSGYFFDSGSFGPYKWNVDSQLYYNEEFTNGKKIALIFTDEEERNFLENAPVYDLDMLAQARKVTIPDGINDRNVYEIFFNPVASFRMPSRKGEISEYLFSKRYAVKSGANDCYVDYEKNTVDWSGNGIIFGPYVDAGKGRYKFVVNYTYFDYKDPCIFDISSNATTVLTEFLLENNAQQLEFEITLNNKANLEFRIRNPGASKIRLSSIEIIKL